MTSLENFESALQESIDQNNQDEPISPFSNSPALEHLQMSRLSIIPSTVGYALAKPKNGNPTSAEYASFLANIGRLSVKTVSVESIRRSSDRPYGNGATMTVFPGIWTRNESAGVINQFVALKYCNINLPHGVSSLGEFTNDINSRMNSILQELEVMGGREARYHSSFPKVYGMTWEELLSPAGPQFYRPILIVEAAIGNLLDYVRLGKLDHPKRHETEARFIILLHSAMNFLHKSCGFMHGDMKPSNVLLFYDSIGAGQTVEAKLADFGFAQSVYDRPGKDGLPKIGPGTTPYWSAPEIYEANLTAGQLPRLLGWEKGHTRDYYSFGLLIWFILFGNPVGKPHEEPSFGDEIRFRDIKLRSIDLNTMITEAFAARWRWEVSKQTYAEKLKSIDSSRIRGEKMAKYRKKGKIVEQEWIPRLSAWVETESELHHVYRGCMENVLEYIPSRRVSIVQKRGDEIFTPAQVPTIFTKDRYMEASRVGRDYCTSSQNSDVSGSSGSPIDALAISVLPENLANSVLNCLIQSAEDNEIPNTSRRRCIRSILAFGARSPNRIDINFWQNQEAVLGTSRQKLYFVLERFQGIYPMDTDLQQKSSNWIVEGLTEPAETEIDAPFRQALLKVSPDILRVATRCALWDVVADFALDMKLPDYSARKVPSIFQAVIDGNFSKFQKALQEQRRTFSLRFDGYNLLHFASLYRRHDMMRILVVDCLFDLTWEDDRGWQAMELCVQQHDTDSIIELELLYSLVHEKLIPQGPDEPLQNPCLSLYAPRTLSLIAMKGSATALEFIHLKLKNPKNLLYQINLDFLEEGRTRDDWIPLYAAMRGRRMHAFHRLLQWKAASGNPRYSSEMMIDGKSILWLAIESVAPFFVAALLAHGASLSLKDTAGLTPLQKVCMTSDEAYTFAVKQRLAFHEEMGFLEFILDKERAALESGSSDCKELRKMIVELLLHYGADIDEGADLDQEANIEEIPKETQHSILGISPLAWCLHTHKPDLAKFLIQKGANPFLRSGTSSPLHIAMEENLLDVVECLLDHGVSPDEYLDEMPAVVRAVVYRKPDTFKLLLSRGASLASSIPGGAIALHFIFTDAADSNQTLALQRGIVTEHLASMPRAQLQQLLNKRSHNGHLAIHVAAVWVRGSGSRSLLELIIGNTDDVGALDCNGLNAAASAIQFRNEWFIRCFSKHISSRA